MEQEEIWRDIEGYEGLYQVSNMGRVKSIGYGKERILSPKTDKDGYLLVCLHKEGKRKMFSVHRLVGMTFITNPEGLPMINHRDENPKNNNVDNLEWCDCKYNNNYGTRLEREIQTKIGKGIYDPERCGIGDEKEYQRLYRKKNLEKIREYQREWMREYRQKNRERILECQLEYRRRKKIKETA